MFPTVWQLSYNFIIKLMENSGDSNSNDINNHTINSN